MLFDTPQLQPESTVIPLTTSNPFDPFETLPNTAVGQSNDALSESAFSEFTQAHDFWVETLLEIEIELLIPTVTNLGSPLHQLLLVSFTDDSDVLSLRDELLSEAGISAVDLNYTFSAAVEVNDAGASLDSLVQQQETESIDQHEGTQDNDIEPSGYDLSGTFTVEDSGQVRVDFLVDGGKYKGELALFSLSGMEHLTGTDFIKEAAARARSNSTLGHIVISDHTQGSQYDVIPGEDNSWNKGVYQGPQTFEFDPGDQLGVMLVPNGTVEKVYQNPEEDGSTRPLFSIAAANPNEAVHFSQIVHGSVDSQVFLVEDWRADKDSDYDYNDLIFRLEGATAEIETLDEVIASENDWRETPVGQELINYVAAPIEPETGVEYRPHELLIKIEPGSEETTETLLQSLGAEKIEPLISPQTNPGSPLHQWRFVTFTNDLDVLPLRNELLLESGISAIDLNYIFSATAPPNDADFEKQWGLNNTGQTEGTPGADINALEAWGISEGSRDVTVALLDSGIYYGHPDLEENIWTNRGEIPGDNIDNDGNGYEDDVRGWDFTLGGTGQSGGNLSYDPIDNHGHGTHVAGIIGAVANDEGIRGVSPNVTLMPVKILKELSIDPRKTIATDSRTIAKAISYAIDKGADIINASFGKGLAYPQPIADALSSEKGKGVLFVAAAGNDKDWSKKGEELGKNLDEVPFYPASLGFDNVIAVASTDHNGEILRSSKEHGFVNSNYGPNSVHLTAPGTAILSTWSPQSEGGAHYKQETGTSMAAPHVTGVAALMLSVNPDLTPQQIKQLLITTATPLPDLVDKIISGGQVNAFEALNILTNNTPPTITDIADLTVEEDSEAEDVIFSVDDADITSNPIEDYLEVTATSDNEALITNDATEITTDGLTLKPVNNAFGEANITVSVFDGLATTTESFKVIVNPVNDAPIARDNYYETDENTPHQSGNVITDDTGSGIDEDIDGDTLSLTATSEPEHGEVNHNSDGSFTYIPNENFNGQDSFTYTISDGSGDDNGTATATVTISVAPVNNAPEAADNSYVTTVNAPITGNIILDDTGEGVDKDVDGDTLRISGNSNPFDGVLDLAGDGTFTFTPEPDFMGSTFFNYNITDRPIGGLFSNNAMVEIIVNDIPVATEDTFAITEDMSVSGNVLADNGNGPDSDEIGNSLVATLNTAPVKGSVVIDADGSFTYDPNGQFESLAEGETTSEIFTYTVTDAYGLEDEATVSIEITGVNDAPSVTLPSLVVDDRTQGAVVGELIITDPDSSNFEITLSDNRFEVVEGQLKLKDNVWLNSEEEPTVTLEITVTDDGITQLSTTQSFEIEVNETVFDQVFIGDDNNNNFQGGDGRDLILGNGGNDFFHGGAGADVIDGGEGSDYVGFGDLEYGIKVNLAQNTFTDFEGNPIPDIVRNIERVGGTQYDDEILGDSQRNRFVGFAGNDILSGGEGNDWLQGQEGDDILLGGEGNDLLYPGIGADIVDGGPSDGYGDTVRLYHLDFGIQVDLPQNTFTDLGGNPIPDTIRNIESVEGTQYDDIMLGDSQNNSLQGREGNDLLEGGAGNDRLRGDEGDDILLGGEGNDLLEPGIGADIVDGGPSDGYGDIVQLSYLDFGIRVDLTQNTFTDLSGNPIPDTIRNIESIWGTQYDDIILGNSQINSLRGFKGNDILIGGADIDQLRGDEGNDTLFGGDGNDNLSGGADADNFVFTNFSHGGIDRISDFNTDEGDTLTISSTFSVKLPLGSLSPENFVVGITAEDADDYFIYNNQTGQLYFDPDGSSSEAAVHFATLTNTTTLQSNDIVIVNDIPNINDAPTDIELLGNTVPENTSGAVIGTLNVIDADSSNFTFTISDARFEIVANQLKLKENVSLDFENESSVIFDITVTDDSQLLASYTEEFTISVEDVAENSFPTINRNAWIQQSNIANRDIYFDIAVDRDGNVYTTGAVDFSTSLAQDDKDVALAKYDTQGNELWSNSWGSDDSQETIRPDFGNGIVVDDSGNIYTVSSNSRSTGEGYQESDIFINRYSSDNGDLLWSQKLGDDSKGDYGSSITIDETGNIYATGWTDSPLDSKVPGTPTDAFLVKYTPEGNLLWATQSNTDQFDLASDVDVDSQGNIYLTGTTSGTLEADFENVGALDSFVQKYSTEGKLLWSRQFGSNVDEYTSGVVVNDSSVYITGFTWGAIEDGKNNAGERDIFTAKYDADGNQLWIRQLGTIEDEWISDIAIDSQGNILITGQTAGAFEGTNVGQWDGFIATYDPDGNLILLQQFGSDRYDSSRGIAIDQSDNVYLAGGTDGALGGIHSGGVKDSWVSKNFGAFTQFNPENNHYYEYVSGSYSWEEAKTAAESRTFNGQQGYLATITSETENSFLVNNFDVSAWAGWIGASDAETEGTWRWETGPEAGTSFWQSGTSLGYSNFSTGQPRNLWEGPEGNTGDEDYAHIWFPTHISVPFGTWNDLPNDATDWVWRHPIEATEVGYYVEYGGLN